MIESELFTVKYLKCEHKRHKFKTIIQQITFNKSNKVEYYHFGNDKDINELFDTSYSIIEEIEL